ncbi:MAG: amino acid adenylation domain-containing protein [Gammaproteobacteria bacterium]
MNAQNIAAISALTPMQEGILFHVIKSPDRRAYHSQFSALLQGPLDEARWRDAWQAVIARHDVLRTLFTWEGREKPLQLVRHHVDTPWQTLDWVGATPAQQEANLAALLERDRDLGFDLTRAPLLRCISIDLGNDTHRFVLSFHHLILDGWSMRLLVEDARRLYREGVDGLPTDSPLAPSFTRFVEWQAQRDSTRDNKFWRQRLGAFRTPVFPDIDDGEPPTPNSHVQIERTLDPALHASLTALAREQRITPSSLISAAWALTIAAYTQSDDLVFGVTVSGRPPELENVEHIAGLFINTLPLRVGVDRAATVDQFLSDVHARQIELRGVEAASLAHAQRQSGVPAGTPVFESIVVYESFPASAAAEVTNDFSFELDTFVEYSHFPLALLAVPEDDFRLILISDPARVGERAVVDMLDRVVHVLRALADPASRRVEDLLALPHAQREQVVDVPNRTDVGTDAPTTLWQQMQLAANQTPDRAAVVDETGTTSYRELIARVEQIAAGLRDKGIKPGDSVAILAERSTQTIAGMLGVLAAGAAYVPIGTEAPASRVKQILAQLRANDHDAKLLASSTAIVNLPKDVTALALETLSGDFDDATPALNLDDPAYLIYTSGSTGTPKGVVITHRNLFHSIDARDRYYGDAPTNFLLLSALTTDSSVAGLYWTLGRGGTLTLARERAEQDMATLIDVIETQRISHLLCVPALWSLVLEHAADQDLSALQVAIVAGEACSPELVQRHAQRLPDTALHNEYGPTETTVWCTAARLRPNVAVTIGQPVANTRAYVVDHEFNPVPVGVAGELCIGGAQVAKGYLGDESRTAERFVPSPFEANDRLYRTGDRARWRRDGTLAFVGRVDLQIKVRGFRVEPGDIEARLLDHENVVDALVIQRPRSERRSTPILVAFVCTDTEVTDAELREHMANALPDYMLPQHFERRDALPRTPTGKINRAALASADLRDAASTIPEALPSTDLEHELSAIWCDVLGVSQVGIHDDFFALGGDSLLSIRILARAGKASIHLTPADFFNFPTIASQAQRASLTQKPRAAQSAVTGPLPLMPIQRWFFDVIETGTSQWNLSYRFELGAAIQTDQLRRAVTALLKTHDALRSRFEQQNESWVVTLAPPVDADIVSELDLTAVHANKLTATIHAHADTLNRSLDLGAAPLLRICLVRTPSGQPDQLVIVAHHLIVDAESWGLLTQDLAQALTQIGEGKPPTLAPKTDSLKAWSNRLVTLEADGDFDDAAQYYAKILSPLPGDLTATRTDFVIADLTEGQTENLTIRIPTDDTNALLDASRETRASTQEMLLCAVACALGQRTKGNSVRLEVEGHGRDARLGDLDLSRTIGWLTSVYPIVIATDEDWYNVTAALRATKSAVRDVPDKGVSYGAIRSGTRDAPGARVVREAAGARVLVNYLGQRTNQAETGTLRLIDERCGEARAPAAPRPYLLEINTWLEGEELVLNLAWPGAALNQSDIQAFADDTVTSLRRLGGNEESTAVPQDFPLADLDQQGLDDLSALLDDLDD